MYLLTYVYTCVHVYIYVQTSTYEENVCMHICVYIHVNMYLHIRTCTCICVYIPLYTSHVSIIQQESSDPHGNGQDFSHLFIYVDITITFTALLMKNSSVKTRNHSNNACIGSQNDIDDNNSK